MFKYLVIVMFVERLYPYRRLRKPAFRITLSTNHRVETHGIQPQTYARIASAASRQASSICCLAPTNCIAVMSRYLFPKEAGACLEGRPGRRLTGVTALPVALAARCLAHRLRCAAAILSRDSADIFPRGMLRSRLG